MLDLATEKKNLVKALKDISEGEHRVEQQLQLVEALRSRGQGGVAEAEELLATFRSTLESWRGHRDQIEEAIRRLEKAEK